MRGGFEIHEQKGSTVVLYVLFGIHCCDDELYEMAGISRRSHLQLRSIAPAILESRIKGMTSS